MPPGLADGPRNQVLIRHTSIRMLDAHDGSEAEPVVQRTLQLRGPSTHDDSPQQPDLGDAQGQGSPTLDMLRMQTELSFLKERVDRIDRGGSQIVNAFDNAVVRLEGDIKKATDKTRQVEGELGAAREEVTAVKHRLAEVGGVKDEILDLRGDVKDDKDSLALVKAELSEVKRIAKEASASTDLASLAAELRETRTLARQVQGLYDDANDASDLLKLDLGAAKTDMRKLKEEVAVVKKGLASAREAAKSSLAVEKDFKKELSDLHAELKRLRDEASKEKYLAREAASVAKEHAKEASALRAELKQLRHELEQDRAAKKLEPRQPAFPAKELEILTDSIAKIGSRASQVETLQMEFELFKSRVKRLEASGQDGSGIGVAQQQHQAAAGRRGSDDVSLVNAEEPHHSYGTLPARDEGGRKRRTTNGGRDPYQVPDTPPPAKRPALTSDFSSAPRTGSYRTASESRAGSPSPLNNITVSTGGSAEGTRTTKAGLPDRRVRNGKRKSAGGRLSGGGIGRPND